MRTVDEVIRWLRANTDPQDMGAANVASAIAIFEETVHKMDRTGIFALRTIDLGRPEHMGE